MVYTDVFARAQAAFKARLAQALELLSRALFGRIHLPESISAQLGELRDKGTVVVLTRGHTNGYALAFTHLLARTPLETLGFVGGVNFFWRRPLARLLAALSELLGEGEPGPVPLDIRELPKGERAQTLARTLLARRPALVMLPVTQSHNSLFADWTDYLEALVAVARHEHRPLYLLPMVLVAREQSGRGNPGLVDAVFGGTRKPGILRAWAQLWMLRHGVVRSGDPIELSSYLGSHPNEARSVARELRVELHRRMDEEERVVAGPQLTGFDQMAREVLGDEDVRRTMAEEAQRLGRSEPQVEVHSEALLRQVAANYDVRVIKNMEHLLFWLFHRIYDGMAVDEEGLGRVIAASRKGPVVFCPSHKSHIDYLVLSYVLWTHGIAPPHVAAGANLNFFPVGSLFRRCGAFFIRRSFRGAPVYAALMRAYMAYLVRVGTSVEFFLEGTRSRTGKLLSPKFGLLSMLVRAWQHGAREDLVFVPVSIDYERIIEAKSYKRELDGASKQAEDLGGLLRSTKVLRSRYGRVQVQFGEPISLKEWWGDELPRKPVNAEDEESSRKQIERLGFRILHDVGRACSVAPISVAATVLLAHAGRGMSQSTLIERSNRVIAFLAGLTARLSESLADETARVGALLEATHKLVDEGMVVLERAGQDDREPIFRVRDEGRITLDYHRNAIINYFAASALLCRALLRFEARGEVASYEPLADATLWLSQAFKREFIYPTEREPMAAFDETLGVLGVLEVLTVEEGGTIKVLQPETVALLAHLLDTFIECYSIVAATALELRDEVLPEREFVSRALERGRRAYLEGDIARPESTNRTLVESALGFLTDTQLLETSRGRRPILSLPQQQGEGQALEAFIAQLCSYGSAPKSNSPG